MVKKTEMSISVMLNISHWNWGPDYCDPVEKNFRHPIRDDGLDQRRRLLIARRAATAEYLIRPHVAALAVLFTGAGSLALDPIVSP
jgi:hypothetical protein